MPFAYTLDLYMEGKLYSLVNGAHLQKALFLPWFQIHVKFHSKTHTPVNFFFFFLLNMLTSQVLFLHQQKRLNQSFL